MPRRRVEYIKFQNGLWLAGSRDTVPVGYMRRYKGVNSIPTITLRSRYGDETLYNLVAHSLFKFEGARYVGAGTGLYRNGVLLFDSATSARRSFLRMAPTISIQDYLFVAGAGTLRKIDLSGNVTNWGIAAPPDGFTAAANTLNTKTIDSFDGSAGSYTPSNCSVANESSAKQIGTGSLKMTVSDPNTLATATRVGLTIDATQFTGPVTSPDEDFIDYWVRIDDSANVEYVALKLDVSDGSFTNNYYSYKCGMTPATLNPTINGTGFIPGLDTQSLGATEGQNVGGAVGSNEYNQITAGVLGATAHAVTPDLNQIWSHIKIPKKLFSHDTAGGGTWSTVKGIQLVVKTNALGGATVYWDQLQVSGGVGMIGTYQYQVTFLDTITGSRSNPNPTPVEVQNVSRNGVTLSNLPVSSDPQVNAREIWRSVGNGARLWRAAVINDNTTTTFADTVADFVGLNTSSTAVLEAIELPLDNDPPASTYNYTYGPWNGRAWWCRDTATGFQGVVYYSPAGRAEAVQGFVNVSPTDEPTQAGVIWNGVNWVFSRAKLYRIDGTTEPFVSREVFGVPGTPYPYTIVATPYGIVYRAVDTIRIFNGLTSAPLAPDSLQPLLRGQNVENLNSFVGVVAAYANDEYLISDGVETLACNMRLGRWRTLGRGCNALFHEFDTNEVIAGSGSHVISLEKPGITLASGPFEVQTGAADFSTQPTMLERVYIDSNPGGNTLTLTVNMDNDTVALANVTGSTRHLHTQVLNRMCRLVDVNLVGTINGVAEVYGITLEVRDVPLYILENGKFFFHAGAALMILGNVVDMTSGISYYGIEDAVSMLNVVWVPEIRRIYMDANTRGNDIRPRLEFLHKGIVTLPPLHTTTRQMIFWDVNVGDRLVALHLDGDFTEVELFQVALDVQLGEGL